MLSKLALNTQTFLWGIGIALVLGVGGGAGSIWYVKGLQIDAIQATHKAEVAEMATKVATAEGASANLKLTFETSLKDKKNELDKAYVARTASLDAAVSKLAGIRLRDPSASGNSGSTGGQGSTSGSNGSNTNTGELLSPQTSQFLWSFAGESQLYLDRLNQCKVWNAELTSQSQKYYDEIQELKKKLKKS
ncbi:hypothetical protein [Xanthomonas phage X1]|nr:hypothetical protein [Xanthomonas phage X1]